MDLDTEHVPSVVYACFVLHNFSESRDVHINPEAVVSQMAQETREQCCENHHNNISYSYNTSGGSRVREEIKVFF